MFAFSDLEIKIFYQNLGIKETIWRFAKLSKFT